MPPPPQAVSGVSSMKGTELGTDVKKCSTFGTDFWDVYKEYGQRLT